MFNPKGILTPVVEEDQSTDPEEPQEEPHEPYEPYEPHEPQEPRGREPQAREIDDFSQAYSSAGIGQLPDEDTESDHTPLRGPSRDGTFEDDDPLPRHSGGHRPLWQQNRQQGRNLMWL